MTEPGIAYAVGASLEVYLDSGVRWGQDVALVPVEFRHVSIPYTNPPWDS